MIYVGQIGLHVAKRRIVGGIRHGTLKKSPPCPSADAEPRCASQTRAPATQSTEPLIPYFDGDTAIRLNHHPDFSKELTLRAESALSLDDYDPT
jgi:hypothetical protein